MSADLRGTVTLTFHGVEAGLAAKLLEAVNAAGPIPAVALEPAEKPAPKKTRQKKTPAPDLQRDPPILDKYVGTSAHEAAKAAVAAGAPMPPLPKVAVAPITESAPPEETPEVIEGELVADAPLTEADVRGMKDRGEIFKLIAAAADADEEEVAAAFKGCRLKTIQNELISVLTPDPPPPEKKPNLKVVNSTEPLEKTVEAEPTTSAGEDGFYDPENLPAELKKADRFRSVVSYMLNDGLEDADDIAAEVKRLEKHIPVIGRTPAYVRRIPVILKRLKA